jgi:N-acetylglucosaminyldiphosphoundecaprenol N-acetyl-beta-D-mannosaminyltransferase
VIDLGRHPVLGVRVSAVDYERATARILEAAHAARPLAVSALAVHGVMTGALDPVHARRLNGLDLVVPDGQPVRWALRWLHGRRLPDRVYGPELMLRVTRACAAQGLPIYLYGSTRDVLDDLALQLCARFPGLRVAGREPSRFRRLSTEEQGEVVEGIRASGARVVFVGLGCPRQEVWAFENRSAIGVPILAVGAAFDFHAGRLPQAPALLQRLGLEWGFRLLQEPARLWRRYLLLNPLFLWQVALQRSGARAWPAALPDGNETLELYG